MRIFGLFFLVAAEALQLLHQQQTLPPLRVLHAIDGKRIWTAVITNLGHHVITTRVQGCVRVCDPSTGNQLDAYNIPLQGMRLEPRRSVMTRLPIPLPPYEGGPVAVTVDIFFRDVSHKFIDSITYI